MRCELPARALGATVLERGTYLSDKQTPEQCWEPFRGQMSVWQIPANWAAVHAMRDYRRIAAGAALVEVDDDYVNWDRNYVRGQTKLAEINTDVGWVEEDVPEWGHPGIASPHVHVRALEEAEAVIVSTEHLASVIRPINSRTYVCRNIVDPDDWPAATTEPDDVFRIMFSASPNMRDLALIGPAMEWAAKQPGVEAIVVGYKPRWRGVRELGWIDSLVQYRQTMADLRPDVWLRPIETTRFSRAKSDLKILEAAMVGALPIVTPYNPYLDWRETPVRFALSQKDWQQELRWAIRHRDDVRAGASEVREMVLRERGLESAATDWGRALSAASIVLAV